MDLDLSHRSNRLTPTKLKAGVSPATNESDFLLKKHKFELTPAALEADLPSDVKPEDFVSKNRKSEETPANRKSDETPAFIKEDLTSDDDLLSDGETPAIEDDEDPPRVWKQRSSGNPNEENIVEELPNAFSDAPQSKVRASDYVAVDYEGLVSNEEDMRNFQLYIEDYNRSEGFDIEHFSNKIFGGLRTLNLDKDDPCFVDGIVTRDCKKSVEAALWVYNEKNQCHFELEKIVKCYFVSGTHYYATFDARDKHTGVIRTYQTQVGRSHWTGKTTIYRFRVKPE